MSWFLKHKLLTLLIIAGIVYWIKNPAGQFGMHQKGFVVYNRIPIPQFDCYIDTKGKIHLESDLSTTVNVNYWYSEHFLKDRNKSLVLIPLIIGTGFGDEAIKQFDTELMQRIRDRQFEPKFVPSKKAVADYNKLREAGKPVAILLKVK